MIYEELKRAWEENKSKINGPATESEIEDFEKRHQIILPASFKDYLRVVNGMQQYEADAELISFFSLAEMSDNLPRSRFNPLGEMRFADFCMGSHGYVFDLTNGQEHVLASDYGGNHKLLATSFTSFISMYLQDLDSIAFCW